MEQNEELETVRGLHLDPQCCLTFHQVYRERLQHIESQSIVDITRRAICVVVDAH